MGPLTATSSSPSPSGCLLPAQLPPLLPGEPGPLSLGAPGVIGGAFTRARFGDIRVQLRLRARANAQRRGLRSLRARLVRRAPQMLAGVAQAEREHAGAYIERELACFESPTGFKGPYELLFASGHKVILAATGALAR